MVRILAGFVAAVLAVLGVCAPARSDDPVHLVRPVTGEVIADFDRPELEWSQGHRGIDLAAGPGSVVVAAAGGRVSHVGVIAGVATISVTHDESSRLRTTYQPVVAVVSVGDHVAAGSVIGHLAARDQPAEHPGLHFGLLRGDDYLDPLLWMGSEPIRLLPASARPTAVPMILGPGLPANPNNSVRPADGPVSSPYGMRLHPVLKVWRMHDGVDLAAACATPVRSVTAGRVSTVERHQAYGIRVIVDHTDGTRTGYAHLAGSAVSVGQSVQAGQRLGSVGSTGWSTGCHLHLMAWRAGQVVDPTGLVR